MDRACIRGYQAAFRRTIIRTCRSGRPGKRIARRLRRVGCLGHLSTKKGGSEARNDRVPMSSLPTDDQYLFVTLDRLSCLAEIGVRLAEIGERGALAGAVSNPSVGRESRLGPRDPLTRVEP